MKVKFKFDFLGNKIWNEIEYPDDTTNEKLKEDLTNWLLHRIGSFATAEIIE